MMFHRRSGRADQSCLKEIDLCPAVHLSLDELELGDLAFGLAVRPRLDQGSMAMSLVTPEAKEPIRLSLAAAIQGTRSASFLFRIMV
jgi:hypothetical protein